MNELTESDKFFIENNFDKLSLEELTKSVNKKSKLVEDYVLVISQKKYEESLKKEQNDAKPDKQESPLIKAYGRNKKYGAVVLTTAAAQINDELARQSGGIKYDPSSVNPCQK